MLIFANPLLMSRASSLGMRQPQVRSNYLGSLSPQNPNTPYPARPVCRRSISSRAAELGISAVRLHMDWSIRMQASCLKESQYISQMPT